VRTSKTITLAALLLTAASSPVMASGNTAELAVTAQILPSACELSVGATELRVSWVDTRVRNGDLMSISVPPTSVAVRCASPTRFGLHFTDDSPAAITGSGQFILARDGVDVLSMEGILNDATVDGARAEIRRIGRFGTVDTNRVRPGVPGEYMIWTTAAASEAEASLAFSALIPSISSLPITEEMELEGRVSMELVYL